ncbi:MAG: hypothetical protein IJZ36_01355 [Bacilli bacterium]|nr:hypothetical protein [Bacilli bacterium]
MQNMQSYILNKINIIDEVGNSILYSDEYIKWLEDFTSIYPIFANDDFKDSNISFNDLVHVVNLNNFFNFIDRYAMVNNLYQEKTSYAREYYIYYNNIGYSIMCIKNSIIMCRRIPIFDINKFIDIEYIYNKIDKIKLLIKDNINNDYDIDNIKEKIKKNINSVLS